MIEIKKVSKEYFGERVVDEIDFTVKKGGVFGFLGQNGSGKTTTMKMVVGLISADGGEILIDGESPLMRETRKKIGFMPEAPYFYERLTGLEFLRFCYGLFEPKNAKTNDDYGKILKQVGIYEVRNNPIRSYSKGMRQRLGFAQAIVNDPEYIFFDEPLDGLDPMGRKEAKEIIKGLKKEGKTIFFNSHILYDVEELCDEIGIIHKGKILYKGPVREFAGNKSLENRFVELVEEKRKQRSGDRGEKSV